MAYSFANSDALVSHLDSFVPGLPDPILRQRYTGMVCVVSAAAFEVSIKEIFCTFAQRKHKVLGSFADAYFEHLSGRIKLKEIRENYVKRFGAQYLMRFDRELAKVERKTLTDRGKSVKSAYGNVIVWRHQFAHEGDVPGNASFAEAVESYSLGKLLVDCLERCMTR